MFGEEGQLQHVSLRHRLLAVLLEDRPGGRAEVGAFVPNILKASCSGIHCLPGTTAHHKAAFLRHIPEPGCGRLCTESYSMSPFVPSWLGEIMQLKRGTGLNTGVLRLNVKHCCVRSTSYFCLSRVRHPNEHFTNLWALLVL